MNDEKMRDRTEQHGEELFSAKVKAGSRTYFINVQRAANGAKYLKIGESRRGKGDERHEHHRVMVFEEHLPDFISVFQEACGYLACQQSGEGGGHGLAEQRLRELRAVHPRAYEKWTDDEDERLRAEVARGTSRAELATLFQRQRSAISSRLRKLGLLGQPE